MKHIPALIVCLMMVFLMPPDALANDISDLKESVQAVREKLIVLLVTTDKQKQMRYMEKIRLLTQEIDTRIKLLEGSNLSEEFRERLSEFKVVWATFKITRDTEIIPNILSGDEDKIKEAKIIARTVQAERFQKMQELLQ